MAITNITTPQIVSIDQNPIAVRITSNIAPTRNFFNYLRILFTATGPAVGEQFTISYNEIKETFTVRAAADDTGNTISAKLVSQTLDEYKDQVTSELLRNYNIFSDFVIETVTQTVEGAVRLNPRNIPDLKMELDSNLTNTEVSQIQATNTAYVENLNILLLVEIYNQQTAEYDAPKSHLLPVLQTQKPVEFDIQKDFNLRYHLPSSASIFLEEAEKTTENWTKYRISYTEFGGSPARARAITMNETVFYALHGKLGYWNMFQAWWLYTKDSGRFLTERGLEKTVSVDEPDFLYWIAKEAGSHQLTVEVTYRDDTSEEFLQPLSIDLEIGEVAYFSTGLMQLGFECYDDNPIIKYTVQLNVEGFPVSLKYKYILTTDDVPYQRYYLAGNRLGGMDVIKTTGKRTDSVAHTQQQGERIITKSVHDARRGSLLTYDRRQQQTFVQPSGHKSKAEIEIIENLLQIGKWWEIDIKNGDFIPIRLAADSIELYKDENDLEGISFSFARSWEE